MSFGEIITAAAVSIVAGIFLTAIVLAAMKTFQESGDTEKQAMWKASLAVAVTIFVVTLLLEHVI